MLLHILGGNDVFLFLNGLITFAAVVLFCFVIATKLWIYQGQIKRPITIDSKLEVEHMFELIVDTVVIVIFGAPGLLSCLLARMLHDLTD